MSWLVWVMACERDPSTPPLPDTPADDQLLGAPFDSDSDGDGVPNSVDCAPFDPRVFPGAHEECNGRDDNCDGLPDPQADRDVDGDGFLWCEECDDNSSRVHPGADDIEGDQLDSDCDGTDGVGIVLSSPLLVGQSDRRTVGVALAGGDVDGDGCDELLIGEPGGWANFPPTPNGATLGTDCFPWSDGLTTLEGEWTYMGYSTELAPGRVVIHEWGWQGAWGRILVFDEHFGPDATPLLEVLGGGLTPGYKIDRMTVLGEPAQWLLIGDQPSLDYPGKYFLLDIERTGTVDFEYESPDWVLETDSFSANVGSGLGDVGDRDGDGQVDLGVVAESGERPARFFPQVTGGHVDDAPEIWTDPHPGDLVQPSLRSGGDLDGDGLSEAVYASLFGDGEEGLSGRAFLLPWLGSGDFDMEARAQVRIDGEYYFDNFGSDSEVADIDGDGFNDLLVSAPGETLADSRPGKVMLFIGPFAPGVRTTDDAALVYVGEQDGDYAGISLATGDFDGNGRTDIAIGAPFAYRDGLFQAGAVYVLIDPL